MFSISKTMQLLTLRIQGATSCGSALSFYCPWASLMIVWKYKACVINNEVTTTYPHYRQVWADNAQDGAMNSIILDAVGRMELFVNRRASNPELGDCCYSGVWDGAFTGAVLWAERYFFLQWSSLFNFSKICIIAPCPNCH